MNGEYIVNDKVARGEIAMDIIYRKLARDEIVNLCGNPQIKAAFFGTAFLDKRPKSEWNKEYLSLLSCAVVAECFNRDYLLHLDEVADFVSKVTFKRIALIGVITVLVIIAGVVVYKYVLSGV